MVILTSYVDYGYSVELQRGFIYINLRNTIKKIEDPNIKLYILTNVTDKKIEGLENTDYTVIDYPRYVWSYVEKVFYSFKLSYELGEDVLWVDFDKFGLHNEFIMGVVNKRYVNNSLLWHEPWNDEGKYLFRSTRESEYFRMFLHRQDIDDGDLEPLMEQIFYIPKGITTVEMLRQIDLAKPLVEHGSFIEGYPRRTPNGLVNQGHGEGIILAYLITKYNLPNGSFLDPNMGTIPLI